MMIQIRFPLFIALTFVAISCAGEEAKLPAGSSLSDEIKNRATEYGKGGALVGAVTLIAKGSEILDLQAYGVKNVESGEPVTTDSIFKIHSFTKAITCTAALMLYDEGKYHFDDPVSKWIPEFSAITVAGEKGAIPVPAKQPILVKHLFTHTSGLSYQHSGLFKKSKNLESLVAVLAKEPLSFQPGESWEYGMSIDVLGRLIEIWSGRDFSTFLDTRIIKPLGMVDTAFCVPTEKENRRVTIYSSSKGDSDDWAVDPENADVPHETPGLCMPGGGLYSTATDYYGFLRMIQNKAEWEGKRYLQPDTFHLMITNQVPDEVGWIRFGKEVRDGFGYGFGFNTVTRNSAWDPDARVGECGWGGKASCHYWFEPASGITVITLEQIFPYRRSLEKALKGVIYQSVK